MINPLNRQNLPANILKSTILIKVVKSTKIMAQFGLIYLLHNYLYTDYT